MIFFFNLLSGFKKTHQQQKKSLNCTCQSYIKLVYFKTPAFTPNYVDFWCQNVCMFWMLMKNDYSLIEFFFFTSLSFFSHIKFWCAFSTHGHIQSVNGVMYKCTSWHLNNDYEKDTLCKAQFFERCIMYYSEDTLSNVSNISLFADT